MISRESKRSTKPRSPNRFDKKLHPALQSWFSSLYPELSEIQKLALPHTLAGENTLILAPTGSGKTFAAFLSVLSGLAKRASENKLPNAVCAIYVSPLKALDTDIHRNLTPAWEAVNAALPESQQIRMEIRTGDTRAKRSLPASAPPPSSDSDDARKLEFYPVAERMAGERL